MTEATPLELILNYFIVPFKDLKVFKGLWIHLPTTSTGGWLGGWLGGVSETGNKANLSLSLSSG